MHRSRTALLLALPLLGLSGATLAQESANPARPAPRPAAPRAVPVQVAEAAGTSRVTLNLGRDAIYVLRSTSTGYELRLRGSFPLDLGAVRPLSHLTGLSAEQEGDETVLRLALPCDCTVEARPGRRDLTLTIRPAAGAAAAAPAATRPAAGVSAPVIVRNAARADHARLALDFAGEVPPFEVRRTGRTYDVRFRGTETFDLARFVPMNDLPAVSAVQDGAESTLRFILGCDCEVESLTQGQTLRFLIRPAGAPQISSHATPVTGAAPARQAQGASPEPARPEPPPNAAEEARRRRLLDDAVRMNLMTRAQADALLQGARQRGPEPAAPPAAAEAPPAAPRSTEAQPTAAAPRSTEAQPTAPRGAEAQPPAATRPPAAPPAPAGRRTAGNRAPEAPNAEEVAVLRETITRQLSAMSGGGSGASGAPPVPPAATPAGAAPVPGGTAAPGRAPAAQAARTAPAAAAPAGPAPATTAAAPAARPRPACAPEFDPGRWGQDAPGETTAERLALLRRAAAASAEDPGAIAALAEFQMSLGLVNEALELLSDRIDDTLAEATRLRLQRVRDVGRLIRRQPIDRASPLLATPAECEREDLALWQALAAGAAGDAPRLVQALPRAQRSLRAAPDRLRLAMTFALADALGEEVEALRLLAAPIRTAATTTEAEEAGRHWLLARIAGLSGARDEERLHLARAAAATRTVPGLFAAARLAARQADRPAGAAATPQHRQAEERLVDLARTYRHDALGEEAAMLYAQLLLGRNSLASALVAADAASLAGGRAATGNRGAALAARILRLLFVDPEGRSLPTAEERLGLFWGFEGYATAGERGDDIRMGAARLMLERDLPDAALEVAHQLAPATLQTEAGALLAARAEAAAPQGDPQKALALLRGQATAGEEGRRAAAQALGRLGRHADAAKELAGLRGRADLGARARHLFLAQDWTGAANAYAELLRDPALDAAQRSEATSRYATAGALSPAGVARVPAELLAPVDPGTRSLLLLLAHEAPPAPAAAASPRINLILSAIDRAKRIEAMVPQTEAR